MMQGVRESLQSVCKVLECRSKSSARCGGGGAKMKRKLAHGWVIAVATLGAAAVAACGGGGGGGAAKASADFQSKLSKKPLTLTFLWFEWPPAHALEALGKEYSKTRPNVTVKVNTVPIANWHDAIFTQFAARRTNFDIPILDSQNIGEAVT